MRLIKTLMLMVILIAALLSGVWAGLHSQSSYIALYSAPNEQSSIVERVSPERSVVAIYQSGQWLKVGDIQNGLVGWVQLSSENSADGNSESMNSNERALIEAVQQQFSQLDALADQQEHELWLQSDTPILEFYILPEQYSA